MNHPSSNCKLTFPFKLWLYTNYDCNLRCSYCVAESSPQAPRRALGLENVKRLVDQAQDLGFTDLFFTGGEPLILDDIYAMLAYASARLPTTVLTNAMLVRGTRLEKLAAIKNSNLNVQVSLDGDTPESHDAYRGKGSWEKTVAGIRLLKSHNFNVTLSTTETPANRERLNLLCEFHHSLGIPEENHFVRPLVQRGFSQTGMTVEPATLVPEITVNVDGIFWHPLLTQPAMQIGPEIFPLANSVACIQKQLEMMMETNQAPKVALK